jgi:chorismate dehydratase
LRLGVVSYLNAEPLVYGLDREPDFRLERDVPARVAERLHREEIDLGMIPSVEYALGRYSIVPGIAIGSRGPVRSVTLLHRGRIESLRRVALDASSRTSAALLRILLRERLGRDPEYVSMSPSAPEMLAAADAALVIGDPALAYHGDADRMDLGEAWKRATGLPFVFAFWAGPSGTLSSREVGRLQEALREGLQALPAISSSYGPRGAGSAAANEAYLRENVAYDLGPDQLRGLREFYRRAHEQGIIPCVPQTRFHEGP